MSNQLSDGESNATKSARVPVKSRSSKRVWTRERLIERILELHAQGIDLSPTSIQRIDSALFSSARSVSHFGSWRKAIEECGLDYECVKRVQQRWSRELILSQIAELHAQGEKLMHPDFKARHRNLYLAACAHRYFGSWRRALLAAGLDHETMREAHVWTRARIQRTIQELSKRGDNLSWSQVEAQCPGIYRAARRPENFGSWQNALMAAGVVAKPQRRGRRAGSAKEKSSEKSGEQTIAQELTQVADVALDTPVAPLTGDAMPNESVVPKKALVSSKSL